MLKEKRGSRKVYARKVRQGRKSKAFSLSRSIYRIVNRKATGILEEDILDTVESQNICC